MEFHYTKESRYSFEEAVEKVQEAAKKRGFGVLAVHDVKQALAKKGIEFTPYTIVEICNPEFAAKALKADINLGLLMPCKVNVYEKDGKVYISGILAEVLSKFSKADLGDLPAKVSRIIKEIVDEVS